MLTHICTSVAMNIVVHPSLNISHRTIRDCSPNLATPVQIPAKPSQVQNSSQHGVSCWQKADAVKAKAKAKAKVMRNLGLNSCTISAQAVQCAR